MKNLVSIIIPTYNRAHLIGETLESIIAQSYQNWECIVVDDGSQDYTNELIEFYCDKDERIRYYHRPWDRPKGANACRNYGVKRSIGDYVMFFDSDDLMTIDHIEVKMSGIVEEDIDYLITKTRYLKTGKTAEPYNLRDYEFNVHNYITQQINWLTYDVIVIATLARIIEFNEQLQSGQEFNYFAKLTSHSKNGKFIDAFTTIRREHSASIRGPLNENVDLFLKSQFNSHWLTYLDLYPRLEKKTRLYLMKKNIGFLLRIPSNHKYFKIQFILAVRREFGFKRSLYYGCGVMSKFLTGKGYYFDKRLRNEL